MTASFTTADGTQVILRRSARARRMTLRVARHGGDVVLTLPPRVSEAEGRAFAESKSDWLRRAVARLPLAQQVAAGVLLPVAGQGVVVTPARIRAARIEGAALLVPEGRPAGPVVQAFLKHRAQLALLDCCTCHAAALGRPYRAISLRDTRSRWGSCTLDGRLMFSWRLAMAPHEVLDYVAAHEVAHLAHMDHSPRFWAAVERLMPGYGSRRLWLRQQGDGLLAWRFRD
ncbi:MAG: M48 family metallopeptidase [Paracoccus sp. (in: a-proteobacteria)]